MITEIVLDSYNEDPVNIIRVRKDEKKSIYGEVDIYVVEHIFESRGSDDVEKVWEIEVPAEYHGEE